ncbi:hypothetical protein RHGRI_027118 [Rhododendron griersonianum]|uniref:Uncharacterized protein n=1 Tax=Rhododendron griersonianum TaxID=479676 RepID=A0AAV6IZN0_9ERIC|nr:hypothetical protein RHGRI_027118 [Rhododendron griersonianum]
MGSSESNLSSAGSSREDSAQNRERGDQAVGTAVAAVGAAAAAALVGWYVSGSGSQEKTMKAPGRDYRMPRKDFEKSPADYFRDLHKK